MSVIFGWQICPKFYSKNLFEKHFGQNGVLPNGSLFENDFFRSAAGRKIGPYRAAIVPLEDLPPEQKWKVPETVGGDGSDDRIERLFS
jgi:hypothetical protein